MRDDRVTSDRRGPRIHMARIGGRPLRVVRGTASDGSGVTRVLVAVTYFHGRGCLHLERGVFRRAACRFAVYQRASGTRRWRLRLPHAIRGPVAIYVRAVDGVGNVSRPLLRKAVIR